MEILNLIIVALLVPLAIYRFGHTPVWLSTLVLWLIVSVASVGVFKPVSLALMLLVIYVSLISLTRGGPARKDKLGVNLSERPLGSIGGAECRVITGSELPKHNHDRGDYNRLVIANKENTASPRSKLDKEDPSVTNEVNLLKSATIKPWGQTKPRAHDNMPPHVALRYCIKR